MKFRSFAAAALFAATLMVSGTAMAAAGYTTTAMRLRAGPGTDYPIVTRIPGNARVVVNGCIASWNWCDVSWRGIHGWTSGRLLQIENEQQRYYVYQEGPIVGLPVVIFTQRDYWDHYYRDRPFYRDWRGPDHGRGHGHGRGHDHWDRR